MTMTTQTVVNQREVTANGIIQVRLAKQVLNGAQVISSEWHRFTLSPGCDIAATIDNVNSHLATMGFPAITAVDNATIVAMTVNEWTPTVVAAYQASLVPPRLLHGT